MAYEMLSEPIRLHIRKKGWENLRQIQAAAIPRILNTDEHYILAAHTASGKTEAAFFPILSQVDFMEPGVQVLYISPLIALINDQWKRLDELCRVLEVEVTKWHGEANRSTKKRLLKDPQGVVLITPESIEAMMVNSPASISVLFNRLKFVVIDEIHSFLGADRGTQLLSLLYRIQMLTGNSFRIVGLSATIGTENFQEIKKLTGEAGRTKVLVDRTRKKTMANFRFFDETAKQYSLDLIKELYKETAGSKVLIFPNSRGRTEEIAVNLKRISKRVNGHENYFSHHSSVAKEIRESVEHFAKSNKRYDFSIACTSTLELGIDIGTVDKVVQIDSTFSVASLVQRIGRSGRKEGEESKVALFATDRWSLLTSLACWHLYQRGFLEPLKVSKLPYDLLWHQMLSIVKQTNGISIRQLVVQLKSNPAFTNIPEKEISILVQHSVDRDYLEKIRHEVILGLEGERKVNSREFYSVFISTDDLVVTGGGKKIGKVSYSPLLKVGENILLAAQKWKIKDVDFESKKIEVVKAKDGRPPIFEGGGGDLHPEIHREMRRILASADKYPELDADSQKEINGLRFDFASFEIKNPDKDVPIVIQDDKLLIFTFSGSKILKSLHIMFSFFEFETRFWDQTSVLEIRGLPEEILSMLTSDALRSIDIDAMLKQELDDEKPILGFSKFGAYIPQHQQIAIVKERSFDFEGAISWVEHSHLVIMSDS